MKRAYNWIWFIVGLSVCTSCVKDEFEGVKTNGRTFEVAYSFDDAQTRSVAAESSEKILNDVALLFYKEEDESYVAHQMVTLPAGGNTGTFPLVIPDAILAGAKYKVLVVGNYNKYRPGGLSLADYMAGQSAQTYTKMREELVSEIQSINRVTTPLPFCGMLLGVDGKESSLTGPDKNAPALGVSVRFSRSVARFDLRHMAADKLNIAWIKVCNYRSKGYLYHNDAPAGNVVAGTGANPPSDANPNGYLKVDPPSGDAKQSVVNGGLYAYANIVPYSAQDDKVTTCLMIAGYYQKDGPGSNTSKLTYYRVNVSQNGKSQVLKRNYVYTVVVNNVKKEGADSEDGAAAEKEQLLDYVVDDTWENNDNNTTTDGAGNFLTVSRTSVVMDSPADEKALIKVSVKKGTGWKLKWNTNPETAFAFEQVDENSFNIVTTGENTTPFTRNAKLDVEVTGINPAPANPLTIQINVTQLSSVSDPQMLLVEGKGNDFGFPISGQGESISLQVLTGGSASRWKVTPDNALSQFIEKIQTTTGAHKGYIQLKFTPNVSNGIKSGILKVERLLTDGTTDTKVSPIQITFTQEKSSYIVTVIPNHSKDPLVIDGFSRDRSNLGDIVNKSFRVLLADPVRYPYCKVECSFNQGTDAFLSLTSAISNKPAVSHKENPAPSTIPKALNGDTFYLNVFRTGPGDPDLHGTITVTAVPHSTAFKQVEFSFPVVITSSCVIGDVVFDRVPGEPDSIKYQLADRNVGASPKIGPGSAPVGLNYTMDLNHNDSDSKRTEFRGRLIDVDNLLKDSDCQKFGQENYTGTEAEGWMIPTPNQWSAIIFYHFSSKRRLFVLSLQKTEDGKSIGAYLPLYGSPAFTASPLSCSYYTNKPVYNSNNFFSGFDKIILSDVIGSKVVTGRSPSVLRCIRKLD